MAFGKKDWRKIVVEDQVYYWHVFYIGHSEAQSLMLWVRPQSQPHRLLAVRNAWCSGQINGALGLMTPGVVRSCILRAKAADWLGSRPKLASVVLFDNPVRHVILQPLWLTSTAVAFAEGIYAKKDFDRLPILADALQDAGCENADILTHLRGDGPHVRGCWALDLVLRLR